MSACPRRFVDSFVRDAFAPARGLFKSTPENFAYPDPSLLEAVSGAGVACLLL